MGRNVNPTPQFFDDAGDPLISGKMFYFDSGTDTPKTTFADVNLTIANTNPVILTADGRLPNVFFDGTARQILTKSDDTQIWDKDPVGGDNIGAAFDPWTATFIYAENNIVEGSDGAFYISFVDANEGNDPTTSPSFWQEIEFINVYNANVTYDIGDTVKASDNNFYKSLVGSNQGNDPTVSPTEWGSPFEGVASVSSGDAVTVDNADTDNPIIDLDIEKETLVTAATGDQVAIADASDSDAIKKVTVDSIAALVDTSAFMAKSANLSDVADTQTSLDNIVAGNTVGNIKGADLTSANPLVVGTDGDFFDVTGVVGIASMTAAADRNFFTQFDGILVLTNGASMLLPGAANITTAAGDVAEWQSTATDTVICVNYTRADGASIVTALVNDLTPQLGAALETNSFAINESEGAAVASATTTDIFGGDDGNTLHITGTTTIVDFTDASSVGQWRKIIFDGILTLTHGSGITLPGSANITTAAGDYAFVYADAVGAFTVLYFKEDGKALIASPGAFESALLHVRDEQTSGTQGGTFTSGADRVRVLNTVLVNDIPGVTLVSNQILGVPAGTYRAVCRAPVKNVNSHTAFLFDVTGAAVLVVGASANAAASGAVGGNAWVIGQFILSTASTIELRHRANTTAATVGLGEAVPASSNVEVYAEVQLWKVG